MLAWDPPCPRLLACGTPPFRLPAPSIQDSIQEAGDETQEGEQEKGDGLEDLSLSSLRRKLGRLQEKGVARQVRDLRPRRQPPCWTLLRAKQLLSAKPKTETPKVPLSRTHTHSLSLSMTLAVPCPAGAADLE